MQVEDQERSAVRLTEIAHPHDSGVVDTPEDVFLSVFDIYASTEMASWLRQVTCPCLVLTGELDGGCNPRLNRFIADALPDSELVILDGLKHSILIEGPDRVLPPVRDFLMRHRG